MVSLAWRDQRILKLNVFCQRAIGILDIDGPVAVHLDAFIAWLAGRSRLLLLGWLCRWIDGQTSLGQGRSRSRSRDGDIAALNSGGLLGDDHRRQGKIVNSPHTPASRRMS